MSEQKEGVVCFYCQMRIWRMEYNKRIFEYAGVGKAGAEVFIISVNASATQVCGARFCCEVFRSRVGLYSRMMPTQTFPKF